MPGRHHRNAQTVTKVGTELANVARAGEVQHFRGKPFDDFGSATRMAPHRGIEAQAVLETERTYARAREVEPDDRTVVHEPRFWACMHGQQRDVPALGARLDCHGSPCDAVGLVVPV